MRLAPLMRSMRSFLRSMGVGAVATLADLAALTLLVELCGLPPAFANVPALVFGLAIQFFGNKLFAFEDRSRALMKQGLQFAAVETGTLALNAIGFHLLVTLTPIPYLAARLLGQSLVYVGFSYPLWARIFRSA